MPSNPSSSSSAPVLKKRKISARKGAATVTTAAASVAPKRTPNSLKPIVDQAIVPTSDGAPAEDVVFDVDNPLAFLHARTPFKCKIATKLGPEDSFNQLRENEIGYHIEMNAPLHLCSLKFRLNVDVVVKEARMFRVMATTDHGELTDALNVFANASTADPPVIDMNKFVVVINNYWVEGMRRAMFFVDCERRYWKLLGRLKAPTLPVPPTLWKDNKKRKRNAIPLFEKVMEGIDEDESGVKALYARPELLHKVGGARIRMMTLKHGKTSFSVSWHFNVDVDGKAGSEIQAVAIEDVDEEEMLMLPPEEPEALEDISQEPTIVNGDDLQAAALAAGNAQLEHTGNKREEKPIKPIAGFSPGKRNAEKIVFDRTGRELHTDFDGLLLQKGLRNATLHAAQALFPPDMIQDISLLEVSDPSMLELISQEQQRQPPPAREEAVSTTATPTPAPLRLGQEEVDRKYQPQQRGGEDDYVEERRSLQHFNGPPRFDPQLHDPNRPHAEAQQKESQVDNQQQPTSYQYERQLQSRLQQSMPVAYPSMENMDHQHAPPHYQPAVSNRYGFHPHGPY